MGSGVLQNSIRQAPSARVANNQQFAAAISGSSDRSRQMAWPLPGGPAGLGEIDARQARAVWTAGEEQEQQGRTKN